MLNFKSQRRLPWRFDFNRHTHPSTTEKPVEIPMESPYTVLYTQNPKIFHTYTTNHIPQVFSLEAYFAVSYAGLYRLCI